MTYENWSDVPPAVLEGLVEMLANLYPPDDGASLVPPEELASLNYRRGAQRPRIDAERALRNLTNA